jgi:tetratricopeptide (TPR) repeat protein
MPCMEPIDANSDKTIETHSHPDPSNSVSSTEPSTSIPFSRKRLLLVIIAILILTIGLSAAGGYWVGNKQGEENRKESIALVSNSQFQLALEDLAAGRYENARQRLEYISHLDPSYPGVAEKLAEALLYLNVPTATAIRLATPTPNLSPVMDLFDQAIIAMSEEDWSLAIETLLLIRSKDPTYRSIDVDGLMFDCLRNRGVQRISQEGLLEEGIYDLSRAELFGPLDRDADSWRSWAELYLLANSYMGLDWAKATTYFSQLYAIAPYLKNDTYLKYAISSRAYGDQLITDKDPCAAQLQYEQSLLAWENAELFPTATKAAHACLTATAPAPLPPPPTEETPATEETPLEEEFTSTPSPTATPGS